MNDSLDSLGNNLTCDINTTCKHTVNCKDCKKCEKREDDPRPYHFKYFKGCIPQNLKLVNRKLACIFHNKRSYKCHIRLLQKALKHGLILKNVDRVMKFKQNTWLGSLFV